MVGESHESVRWSSYSPRTVFVFAALSQSVCSTTAQYVKKHLVCFSQYHSDTTYYCGIVNISNLLSELFKCRGLLNIEIRK